MKILHIVLNNYKNDNRVRRAAECGLSLGATVTVFALSDEKSSALTNENGIDVNRIYLRSRSWSKNRIIQSFKFIELLFKMISQGRQYKPTVVHAHDLDGLIIGFFISRLTKSKLIYDSHEYWTDTGLFGKANSLITKSILVIERILIKRANIVIAVSEGIALLIQNKYKITKPLLVRNLPEKWPTDIELRMRKKLGIPAEVIVVLYQGVIAGEGVIDLINTFKLINGPAVLVYLGNGNNVDTLKEISAHMVQKVYFHPSVPHDQLPLFTSDADIGVHSMMGNNLNRINALPNKLFEYIQGGLALIVSDLPEMKRVVDEYDLGLTYPNANVEQLAKKLNLLLADTQLIGQYKNHSRKAAAILNWDKEKVVLENIYKSLVQ